MQISISYRGTGWVGQAESGLDACIPDAGDRAPDVIGLKRKGVSFPLRLFDILRGTDHVLLVGLAGPEVGERLADAARLAGDLRTRFGGHVRAVAVVTEDQTIEPPGIAVLHDRDGAFRKAYGAGDTSLLIRPDGHIGWRGRSFGDAGLVAYLANLLA